MEPRFSFDFRMPVHILYSAWGNLGLGETRKGIRS